MAKVWRTPKISRIVAPSQRAGTSVEAPHRSTEELLYSILSPNVSDTAGLIANIRRGLRFRSWERFLKKSGLPAESVFDVVRIPMRTLARRKKQGRLQPDESDRLVRIARVYVKALDLFGGRLDGARNWLMAPALALGDVTPLEYSATEVGAREVENLIGRLEHGIPS